MLHGDTSTETQKALLELAETQLRRQDYKAAKTTADTVYAIRCELFGRDSLPAISALVIPAICLSNLGELEEAKAMEEKVLGAWETHYGPESRWTAQAMQNLAATLQRLEEFQAAETLYASAAKAFRSDLGDDHPFVTTADEWLAVNRWAPTFGQIRWGGLAVVAAGVLIASYLDIWALALGMGVAAIVLSEGLLRMQGRKYMTTPKWGKALIRPMAVLLLCGAAAITLLIFALHNPVAQALAGLFLVVCFYSLIINIGGVAMARSLRTRDQGP